MVLAYPLAECIDESGRLLHRFENVIMHSDWQPDPPDRFRQLGEEFIFSGGASVPIYVFGVMRSSALKRTRLLGNYIAADWILLAELTLAGKFVEVGEPLSAIRSHAGSASLGKDRKRMDKMQAVLDPSIKGALGVWLSRSRRYAEYYTAIARASIPIRVKLELRAYHTGSLLRRARRNVWRAMNGRDLRPIHR